MICGTWVYSPGLHWMWKHNKHSWGVPWWAITQNEDKSESYIGWTVPQHPSVSSEHWKPLPQERNWMYQRTLTLQTNVSSCKKDETPTQTSTPPECFLKICVLWKFFFLRRCLDEPGITAKRAFSVSICHEKEAAVQRRYAILRDPERVTDVTF